MATTVREEADPDAEYRITQGATGYLVTMQTRGRIGILMTVEWLYRNPETAHAGLDAIIAAQAAWRAGHDGLATEDLHRLAEDAGLRHRHLCEAFDDEPQVAQDVGVFKPAARP